MEKEYLLFSLSLLKTEVFHLAGIPCQKEEKLKYLSSYQSVWTITDECVSLQCCTGNAARNKTGTSAAPQTVGCQNRELHLLEIQALFSLSFFPWHYGYKRGKATENSVPDMPSCLRVCGMVVLLLFCAQFFASLCIWQQLTSAPRNRTKPILLQVLHGWHKPTLRPCD